MFKCFACSVVVSKMSLVAVADEHTLVTFLRAHLVLGTLIRSIWIAVVEVGVDGQIV